MFNYIDKKGQGEIGYDNFTLLLEERWRGIDPVVEMRKNLANRRPNPMQPKVKSELQFKIDKDNSEYQIQQQLEKYTTNQIKVPLDQAQ